MDRTLRHVWVGWTAALAGIALFSLSALAQESTLLTPVEDAVIHSPEALVVFTAPAGTKVSVGVGRGILTVPDVTAETGSDEIHHVRVPLPEGRSQVRILDASGVEELARITLIRASELDRHAASSDAFHTAARERRCVGCHETLAAGGSGPPAVSLDASCLSCHPEIEASPYLHGPSAVYDCFSCHEAEYSPSRFGQKLPQPSSCAECHTSLMARVLGGKKFVHGPVAAGACTACHDPHGGQTTTLLRGSVSGLCLSCHEKAVRGAWSVSLHERLPCTGCHDPHGSQARKLTVSEGNDLCLRCHRGAAFDTLGHALCDHPLEGDANPAAPGKSFGCVSCHPPHGTNDVAKRHIASNASAQRTFCLGCHR